MREIDPNGTVAVLAGRRIDAADAKRRRFPLANVRRVENDIERLLVDEGVDRLVCAAACGADLLALRTAERLAVPALVVLPFERARFKAQSVLDRPGDWGELFDLVVSSADARGDLVELDLGSDDELAYKEGNDALVARARDAGCRRRLAVAVWDGAPREKGDLTAALMRQATRLGFEPRQVHTV